MIQGLLGEVGADSAAEQEAVRPWCQQARESIFQARKLPTFRSRCYSRTLDPSSKVRAVTQGRSFIASSLYVAKL